MQIAHDDLIACVERNRLKVEPKLIRGAVADHATIAADVAAFLAKGGRITEVPQGVSVESGLRCVAAEGRSGTFERRWEIDTRKPAEHGEGLATWRGRDRILLPGTMTTPRAA